MIPFELAAIFTLLQTPATRSDGAARLAAFCGSGHVVLFGKDREIGLFLPAPGLPQTLRGGTRWQTFLQQCGTGLAVSLPDPLGTGETPAYGMTDVDALAAIVFLGARPLPAVLAQIAALLPLLSAPLVLERTVLAADGHAQAAREASRRAGALNEALDVNRRELQAAYRKAEGELASRRFAEQKLRDADRRKDEFLAMLAHELRNPLAPISMAAQILKMTGPDPARLLKTCEIIDRQVTHMTHLLDDLLDVSRVTGGMVTLAQEALDMRAVVEEALEQARPLINSRQHKLSVRMPQVAVPVTGDATRLVQIVTNLVNNSAKYTSPGGQIAVLLTVRDDEVLLAVRDNGIGIDATLLPHVFDLFIQGERSADRSQGGLGLGLALVKSLAERHGGAIRASSAGKAMGSEFVLTLPYASQRSAAPIQGALCAIRAGDALDILIVDDNEDAATTLAMYLETLDHRVSVAFSGAAALERARQRSPDVLLLDIGLPDMDGCALASQLRALPHTQDSILIALTGYGLAADRERSHLAGFNFHLTKPVDPQQLVDLLGSVTAAPKSP